MFPEMPFPFDNNEFPSSLGAVVQRTVLTGEEPAREVIHTSENRWLVSDGVNDPNTPDACVATHMSHVVERNSSVAKLASLGLGQVAHREEPGAPWVVGVHEWLPDDEPFRP